MTNPHDALVSFQQALRDGELSLEPAQVTSGLWLHADRLPSGSLRLTYVTLQRTTVTSFVNAVLADPMQGAPCFQLGYAVPEAMRGQGLATAAVAAAIAELKNGFHQSAGMPTFYIEAIVDEENVASRRVAERTISTSPTSITDQESGLPAFQFILRSDR